MFRIPQFNVSDITSQRLFLISGKIFGFVMMLSLILLEEKSIIASVFTALFARITLLFYYHLVRSCKTLT